MGRSANWPPLIHASRGRDRVYFGGRYHYLGPAGSDESRAAYAKLVAAWATDPDAGTRRAGELLGVELFRAYLDSADAPAGDPQRLRAVRAARLFAELHLLTPAAEFGPVALAAWQAWLCKRATPRGQSLSRAYVRDLVAVVKRVWRWGVRTERLDAGRYEALRSVPGPKYGAARETAPVKPADAADVARTLAHLRGPTAAMVELQALTGMRSGEVCRMRGCDLHRSGRFDVPGVGLVDLDAAGVWVYVPATHKGTHRRKAKFVTLGPKAQAVVAPFLAGRAADTPLFSPADGAAEYKPGLRARLTATAAYHTGSYGKAVARACVKAGVPHWHPHQLRHLAGSLIDAGAGLDAVQAILGHDDPQTSRRYAKRSFAVAAKVAREMG